MQKNNTKFSKKVPKQVIKAYNTAISHYPELANSKIKIKCKKMNYTMETWVDIFFLFKKKKNQVTTIYINNLRGKHKFGDIHKMPQNALIGNIGHELAHALQYKKVSKWFMFINIFGYLFIPRIKKEIERDADLTAIKHGLSKELYESRAYLVHGNNVSKVFQDKLNNIYLSPSEIKELAKNINAPKRF